MNDSPLRFSDQLHLLSNNTVRAIQLCFAQCESSIRITGKEQFEWLTLFSASDIDPLLLACMFDRSSSDLFGSVMNESQIKTNSSHVKKITRELQSNGINPAILITTVLLHTNLWTPSQLAGLANLKKVKQKYDDLLLKMAVDHNGDVSEKAKEMNKIVTTLMCMSFPNYGHEVKVTTALRKFPISKETHLFAIRDQLDIIENVFHSITPTKQETLILVTTMKNISEGRCPQDLALDTMKYIGWLYCRRAEAIGACSGSMTKSDFQKTACVLASSLYLMSSVNLKNMDESLRHIFGKEQCKVYLSISQLHYFRCSIYSKDCQLSSL